MNTSSIGGNRNRQAICTIVASACLAIAPGLMAQPEDSQLDTRQIAAGSSSDHRESADKLTQTLIKDTRTAEIFNRCFDRYVALSNTPGTPLNTEMLIGTMYPRYRWDCMGQWPSGRRHQILWWLAISNKYLNFPNPQIRTEKVNQLVALARTDLERAKIETERLNCLEVAFATVYYQLAVRPEDCDRSIMKLFMSQIRDWPGEEHWDCNFDLGKIAHVCPDLEPEILEFFDQYCPEMDKFINGPLRRGTIVDGMSGYDMSCGRSSENVLFGIGDLDTADLEKAVRNGLNDYLINDMVGLSALRKLINRAMETGGMEAHDACIRLARRAVQPDTILHFYLDATFATNSLETQEQRAEKVEDIIEAVVSIPVESFDRLGWRTNTKKLLERKAGYLAFVEEQSQYPCSAKAITRLREAFREGSLRAGEVLEHMESERQLP